MGQPNSKPSAPSAPPIGRLYHLDNLRTFLTALVILHHTAISYGGLGAWPYMDPHHAQGSSFALSAFNAINQSFFMGSFFYLSGKMSSQTYKRRTVKQFLKAKWVKLGIPVVIYTLLGLPFQIAVMKLIRGEPVDFLEVLLGHLKGLRSVRGPVWYSSLLLLFDTAYSLLPQLSLPDFGFWPTMALNISASSLLRIPSPVQKVLAPLNVRPGYFPQYLIAYILGTRSGPSDLPLLTPHRRNALLATSVLSGSCILGLLHSTPNSSFATLDDGFNTLAISYAVWNETTGFLLGATIMNIFERQEWSRRKWGSLGRYSYAAFLVHPIVCVGVPVALEGWQDDGVVKAGFLGMLNVLGSWGIGWGLVRLPGFGRVLL